MSQQTVEDAIRFRLRSLYCFRLITLSFPQHEPTLFLSHLKLARSEADDDLSIRLEIAGWRVDGLRERSQPDVVLSRCQARNLP
jgi:hypothetical protein